MKKKDIIYHAHFMKLNLCNSKDFAFLLKLFPSLFFFFPLSLPFSLPVPYSPTLLFTISARNVFSFYEIEL